MFSSPERRLPWSIKIHDPTLVASDNRDYVINLLLYVVDGFYRIESLLKRPEYFSPGCGFGMFEG